MNIKSELRQLAWLTFAVTAILWFSKSVLVNWDDSAASLLFCLLYFFAGKLYVHYLLAVGSSSFYVHAVDYGLLPFISPFVGLYLSCIMSECGSFNLNASLPYFLFVTLTIIYAKPLRLNTMAWVHRRDTPWSGSRHLLLNDPPTDRIDLLFFDLFALGIPAFLLIWQIGYTS